MLLPQLIGPVYGLSWESANISFKSPFLPQKTPGQTFFSTHALIPLSPGSGAFCPLSTPLPFDLRPSEAGLLEAISHLD